MGTTHGHGLLRFAIAAVALLSGCFGPDETLSQRASELHLADCSEGQIRSMAPPDAAGYLDRAFDWIHRAIPYCQCTSSAVGGYRTDCSGFVSMVWGLPAPGHTTYSFAGGPWDDHVATRITMDALRTGDALNYPGSPGAHTGHVVLFGGWLDEGHTRFCSLEESHTGTPARVIVRSVDPAYLPMRLASRASCAAHCDGDTLVGSDCGRGNCGAFGSRCVQDGLGARCVFAFCPATGDRDVCWGGSHVGHCVNGALTSQGDCAVYGARCVDDAMGARCVFGLCPATGESDICVDRTHISHCSNGRVTPPGDCGAFAAFCSTRTGTARCESVFCVPTPEDVPVAHDGCWLTGGQRAHCDAVGALTLSPCPAGESCSLVGGTAHCAPTVCPETGESDLCATPNVIGHCLNGSVIRPRDCGADLCSTVSGTPPHCVSRRCVRSADEVPVEHPVCVDDRHVASCDATGALGEPRACDGDARCVTGTDGDHCEAPRAPDASVAPDVASDVPTSADATSSTDARSLRETGLFVDATPVDPARTGTVEGGCATRAPTSRVSLGWLCVGLMVMRRRRSA